MGMLLRFLPEGKPKEMSMLVAGPETEQWLIASNHNFCDRLLCQQHPGILYRSRVALHWAHDSNKRDYPEVHSDSLKSLAGQDPVLS